MATAAKTGAQDMPPTGGYDSLQWERKKLKRIFTTKLTVGIYFAVTAVAHLSYHIQHKKIRAEEIEMRSARHALMPMLVAERDRAFLKQVRINRDEERELMKDVPEWEVGTYFREPVYRTMPTNFHEPTYYEFMGHADFCDATYRILRRHFA